MFHPEYNVDEYDAAASGRRFSRAIDQSNLEQGLAHLRKAIEASCGMRRGTSADVSDAWVCFAQRFRLTARSATVSHLSDAMATGGPTTRLDRFESTSRSMNATLRNASTLLSGLSGLGLETVRMGDLDCELCTHEQPLRRTRQPLIATKGIGRPFGR